MCVVTTSMMVSVTARMTGHPIAEFLSPFSILNPSPLAACLGFSGYYNCQKAILSRGYLQYSYTFQSVQRSLRIKFTSEVLLYSISCNFYRSYGAFLRYPMSFQIAKVRGIPMRLHFTLIIVFFLIAWILASSFMPRYFSKLTTVQY